MKILIKTFLFSSFIFSQYPADSLLSLPDNSISQKIFLYPIAKWQGISYGNNAMNCQFFPSCSNYGAQAIHEKGIISGLAIISDRIIRCNHAAYKVHNKMGGKFYKDGRLIDHVNYTVLEKSKKSPIIAVGLSMAVPGLGRAYAPQGCCLWFFNVRSCNKCRCKINQRRKLFFSFIYWYCINILQW